MYVSTLLGERVSNTKEGQLMLHLSAVLSVFLPLLLIPRGLLLFHCCFGFVWFCFVLFRLVLFFLPCFVPLNTLEDEDRTPFGFSDLPPALRAIGGNPTRNRKVKHGKGGGGFFFSLAA